MAGRPARRHLGPGRRRDAWLRPGDRQPPEVPAGYHRLEPEAGGTPLTVAVCPPRCPSPPPGRTWGWSSQLYATRSATSWGIGDFADLRRLVGWAGEHGAGFRAAQPPACPGDGAGTGTEPLFPELSLLPQPALHPRRGGPGGRRPGRGGVVGRKGEGAQRAKAHRPLPGVGAQVPSPGNAFRPVRGARRRRTDSRPTYASGAPSSTATRRSAPWANVTGCPGRTGRSSTATRRAPRSGSSPPAKGAPASVTTPGCNGCAKSSWRTPRR